MNKYIIQAVFNGCIAYTVIANTLEQTIQEMRDGLHDGYQMYITKGE